MGKRQVGELQISELIVTFMLSELAVNPITDPDVPLMWAVIPILQLLSIEVILSYLATKSNRFKKILSGSPAVLIRRGKLIQKALADNRLEIDELLSELRQNGFSSPGEVEYAILEGNGKISVFPKAEEEVITMRILREGISEKGIAHAVVVDGQIVYEALAEADKDEKWLRQKLAECGGDVKKVFLMTVDDDGEIYMVEQEGRL
ncbi:MAG: DUF421 domain-containing protein [Clostridia bacterium]|nr:DUF421 domain-containing protein [Clostridia bacterium]